jgi:hypothetical protein
MPNHARIKGLTLRTICTQAGIPRDDFLEAYEQTWPGDGVYLRHLRLRAIRPGFANGGGVCWHSCLFGGTISLEVSMTTITIALPDDRLLKLKEMATRFGVAPEELVRVSIEELLTRPEEALERAIDYVLNKNAELYRRLA